MQCQECHEYSHTSTRISVKRHERQVWENVANDHEAGPDYWELQTQEWVGSSPPPPRGALGDGIIDVHVATTTLLVNLAIQYNDSYISYNRVGPIIWHFLGMEFVCNMILI